LLAIRNRPLDDSGLIANREGRAGVPNKQSLERRKETAGFQNLRDALLSYLLGVWLKKGG